jgi:hypothetical protein
MALTRSIGAYDDGTALVPGVGTTPLDTRKSLSALWASAGVVTGGPSPLVTGTTGFAYSVAGPVPFVTTRGPSDGFQMFTNDGTVTVPITNAAGVNTPGAPGPGLQRIDILWVRHPTNTENADTSSAPIFGVESGAAVSSSPAAPSIPVGALELGRNLMLSTATSTTSTGNTISQTAARASLKNDRVQIPAPTAFGTGWSIAEWSGISSNGFVVANFIAVKSSAFTTGEIMFGLPVGYYPLSNHGAGAQQNIGGAAGVSALGVNMDGAVVVYGQSGGNTQVRGTLSFVKA